jgi:hypothetical protein
MLPTRSTTKEVVAKQQEYGQLMDSCIHNHKNQAGISPFRETNSIYVNQHFAPMKLLHRANPLLCLSLKTW